MRAWATSRSGCPPLLTQKTRRPKLATFMFQTINDKFVSQYSLNVHTHFTGGVSLFQKILAVPPRIYVDIPRIRSLKKFLTRRQDSSSSSSTRKSTYFGLCSGWLGWLTSEASPCGFTWGHQITKHKRRPDKIYRCRFSFMPSAQFFL